MPKSSPQWQGKHMTYNSHTMTTLQSSSVLTQELRGNVMPSLIAHFKHILHFIFTRNLSLLARQETHNWTHKTGKISTYPEINTSQGHISSINIT
jgi:D-mannonate dehydratase